MRLQSLLCGLLILIASSGAARGDVSIPLGAPVTAIAAGPSRLFAATSHELLLLDLRGNPIRRLPLEQPEVPAIRRAVIDDRFEASAGVTRADDFDEPYDADLDLEDAENITGRWTSPKKRTRAAAPVVRGVSVLTVDGRYAWWGAVDGLWRMDLEGEAVVRVLRTFTTGVQALATSPDGTHVAVSSDGVVLRSSNGGATFDPLFTVAGAAAEVAVTAAGTVFGLDGAGLRRTRPGAITAEPLDLFLPQAIASCGATTLAIASGRLVVLDEAGARAPPIPTGSFPPDASRLACSTDGSLWAALGTGLWLGRDRGQADELAHLPAAAITAIAATREGVWLATTSGLRWQPAGRPGAILGAGERQRDQPPTEVARPRTGPPWWSFILPRVDLGFVSARSSLRHDVRAFALLTFTLERTSARLLERDNLLARLATARRDNARPSELGFDGARAEEADALIRIQQKETSP